MKNKNFNLPNTLSVFRFIVASIIFIAFFIDINFSFLQIIVVLGALSDKIDGVWARKFKQETKLGFMLDSLADLTFITVCIIYAMVKLNFPIAILFIGLPFIISIILIYIILTLLKKPILSFWQFGKQTESKIPALIAFILVIFYFLNLPGKEYLAWSLIGFIYLMLIYYLFLVLKHAKIINTS